MFVINEPHHIVRKITGNSHESKIYLTFDDGPSDTGTSPILDLLKQHDAKATFFVIGEKAKNNLSLIKKIQNDGHGIASHSSDHSYRHYFQSTKKVKSWIKNSLAELENITSKPQKLFRPPAGILNPPLIQAAKELEISLVLWNHRFYDSIFSLKEKNVRYALKSLNPGDIILLHDHQRKINLYPFLQSLNYMITEIQKSNINLSRLPLT